MSRLARKYKKHKRPTGVPRSNPSSGWLKDLGHDVLPALAGFAGSRLISRMMTLAIHKKWPGAARHAGAISAIASFAGAAWGAHKIKSIEKYADGLVIGAGVGAAATILQTYVPKLGWMMAEVGTTELAPATPTPMPTADFDPEGGDDWGAYNDAFDSGRYTSNPAAVRTGSTQEAQASDTVDMSQDALDRFMSTLAVENNAMGAGGIFSGEN
jgi:hypothetical protein